METYVLNMVVDDADHGGYRFEMGRFSIYQDETYGWYYIDTATDGISVTYLTLVDVVRVVRSFIAEGEVT